MKHGETYRSPEQHCDSQPPSYSISGIYSFCMTQAISGFSSLSVLCSEDKCFFVLYNKIVCVCTQIYLNVYSFLKGSLEVRIYCKVNVLRKSMLMSKFLLLYMGLKCLYQNKQKKTKVNRLVPSVLLTSMQCKSTTV